MWTHFKWLILGVVLTSFITAKESKIDEFPNSDQLTRHEYEPYRSNQSEEVEIIQQHIQQNSQPVDQYKNNPQLESDNDSEETATVIDNITEITTDTPIQKASTSTSRNIDCNGKLCYNKCCPVGQLWSFVVFNCTDVPQEQKNWTPKFQDHYGTELSYEREVVPIVRRPSCKHYGPNEPGYLLENGNYYIPSLNRELTQEDYCIENFHAPVLNIANYANPNGKEYGTSNMVCFEVKELTTYEQVRQYLHPITTMITCVSLSLIIGFYILVKKLREGMGPQGLVLICHSIALLIGNFILFFVILPGEGIFTSPISCIIIAILLHYSFLTAFFWLNVMCYDMWSMIRSSISLQRRSRSSSSKRKRFLWYSLYGWGVPLLIVTISVVLNFIPKYYLPYRFITPQYGVGSCFLPRKNAVRFIYFYGVVAALFLSNLFLLIHTALLLTKVHLEVLNKIKSMLGVEINEEKFNSIRFHAGPLKKDYKQLFINRLMVSTLLAFIWTFEVISLFTDGLEYWALTDLLNTLQGFFLFLIFIYNGEKRELIAERFKEMFSSAKSQLRKVSLVKNDSSTTLSTIIGSIRRPMIHEVSFNEDSKDRSSSSRRPSTDTTVAHDQSVFLTSIYIKPNF